MTRSAALLFVCLAAACSDRSLPEQRGALSLVAAAAHEQLDYGPTQSPVSSGTSFGVTVKATNLQTARPLEVAMVRGEVRAATGEVLMPDMPLVGTPPMTVPAGESQRLAFGVTLSQLHTCPLQCAAPSSQRREDQFVLEAIFTLDGEEVTITAMTDLYCACQENF